MTPRRWLPRLVGLAVAMLLGGRLAAQAPPAGRAAPPQAVNKDNCDDFIKRCTEAITANAKDPYNYYMRGQMYEVKGDPAKAVADYTEAIARNPQDDLPGAGRGAIHASRAKLYMQLGEPDKAIADATRAIELEPKALDSYDVRGLAYASKGAYDQAIADSNAMLAIDPNCVSAYMLRAGCHSAKGDADKALADMTAAIKLDPKERVLYVNRSGLFLQKGQLDSAIADCTEAIRLDPKTCTAYMNRGAALVAQQKYDQAIEDFTQAAQLGEAEEAAGACSFRAYCRAMRGELDRAVSDATETIRLNPKAAGAYHIRGVARLVKREYDAALADFAEAVRLEPKSPELRMSLETAQRVRAQGGASGLTVTGFFKMQREGLNRLQNPTAN